MGVLKLNVCDKDMLYNITMDEEEARWIVDMFKRLQRARVINNLPELDDLDIERMQSFISRIRAKTSRKL